MPRLVRTPEEVLRETQRDLYVIQFHEWNLFGAEKELSGRRDLRVWLRENLPQIEVEELGPSELSGVVVGGVGQFLRVNFDEESLTRYIAAWEFPDGSPKDSRWTCWRYSYHELAAGEAQAFPD